MSHQRSIFLAEPFFRTFTPREPCDTRRYTEGLFAISCASRDEVDTMVRTAVARGGTYALEPQDHRSFYGWSFYDLDGQPVSVASPRTLYRMKKGTVRPKDWGDAEALRRRFRLEDE